MASVMSWFIQEVSSPIWKLNTPQPHAFWKAECLVLWYVSLESYSNVRGCKDNISRSTSLLPYVGLVSVAIVTSSLFYDMPVITEPMIVKKISGYKGRCRCKTSCVTNIQFPSRECGFCHSGRWGGETSRHKQHRFANIDLKHHQTIVLELCFCLPEVWNQFHILHNYHP